MEKTLISLDRNKNKIFEDDYVTFPHSNNPQKKYQVKNFEFTIELHDPETDQYEVLYTKINNPDREMSSDLFHCEVVR